MVHPSFYEMRENMNITFVGHVSKDVNVIGKKESIVAGGGVFYGSIAAQCLGAKAKVYTKCKKEDIPLFSEMSAKKIDAHFLSSHASTSIKNIYPSNNPDERTSEILSLADPFDENDIRDLQEDFLHVNPLWMAEFPEDMIPKVQRKTSFLAGDAQGFLRNVENGKMVHKDWKNKEIYLGYFDLFKVDSVESKILSGEDNLENGMKKIYALGASLVLATYQKGVYVYDGKKFYHATFGKWNLEGRTGRGDTCTAAFLAALNKMNLSAATKFAADITTQKMQYAGPLRC